MIITNVSGGSMSIARYPSRARAGCTFLPYGFLYVRPPIVVKVRSPLQPDGRAMHPAMKGHERLAALMTQHNSAMTTASPAPAADHVLITS